MRFHEVRGLMRTEAVLFDLDDTLIVEDASVEEAFLATCRRAQEQFGVEPKSLAESVRARAREIWRTFPTLDYCHAMGIASWEGLWSDFPGDDPNLEYLRERAPAYRLEAWSRGLADHGMRDGGFAELLAATYRQERSARHVVFPDAEPALIDLRETHKLALVTNGPPDIQREKVEASGLGKYFEAILVSGEVGIGKPDPRIMRLALERLGVAPEAAVMVGNSPWRDVVGAQAAGVRGIWINRAGAVCPPEIMPDAEIWNLSELRRLLTD